MVPFVCAQRAPACPEGCIVPVLGTAPWGSDAPSPRPFQVPPDLGLAGQKLPQGLP